MRSRLLVVSPKPRVERRRMLERARLRTGLTGQSINQEKWVLETSRLSNIVLRRCEIARSDHQPLNVALSTFVGIDPIRANSYAKDFTLRARIYLNLCTNRKYRITKPCWIRIDAKARAFGHIDITILDRNQRIRTVTFVLIGCGEPRGF